MRRSVAGITAVAVALIAHAAGGPAVVAQSVACDVASIQAKAPQGTTITDAAMVEASAGRPRFCQVDGHAASPGNTVNFRLGLPEGWNGKLLFLGVGGLGGTIGHPRARARARLRHGHHRHRPPRERTRLGRATAPRRSTTAIVARTSRAVAAKALTASFYGAAAEACLLRRLLERRPPGADGSAALSRRFRRHDRRATRPPARRCRWAARSCIRRCCRAGEYLSPATIELVSKASSRRATRRTAWKTDS